MRQFSIYSANVGRISVATRRLRTPKPTVAAPKRKLDWQSSSFTLTRNSRSWIRCLTRGSKHREWLLIRRFPQTGYPFVVQSFACLLGSERT